MLCSVLDAAQAAADVNHFVAIVFNASSDMMMLISCTCQQIK